MKVLQSAKNPWIKALQNWEEIVTIVAVSIMLVVCCFSVIARRVFNYGISWSTEVCNICLVYTTFIGGAAAYKRNLHFGMDFMTDHLNQKMRYFVKMLLYGVQILLFGYLCYLSIKYTAASHKVMDITQIPYKWLDLAAVLGFASMYVYSVLFFMMGILHKEEFNKKFVISQSQALQEEAKEREGLE